jgi:DinB superfamily
MVKRVFTLAIAILCIATPVFAQTLTPADRDAALKYLESTRQGVIDATKGLSPAQWNFKQAADRWSVAEVTEHIAAAEDLLFEMITTQVMKAPARTENDDVKVLDQMVLTGVPDRSQKRQAPEPLKPTNRFGSPEAALQHFLDSRAQTIAFLQKTDDLRSHATDSPLGKKLDGYEWILFIAAHSERHTKQINEVKADPKFPK